MAPRLKRLDLLGALVLIAAALLLTTGLLEGGSQWEWDSPQSIVLLILSGILWLAFFWWERLVTLKTHWSQEPMFPWRFVHNRQLMGVLLYVPKLSKCNYADQMQFILAQWTAVLHHCNPDPTKTGDGQRRVTNCIWH